MNSMRIFSIYNSWKLVLLTKTLSGISCLRDMHKLWMSPESFKELGLILETDKSPLENLPGTLLIYMVHGLVTIFPGREQKLLSWDMAKKEPQGILR